MSVDADVDSIIPATSISNLTGEGLDVGAYPYEKRRAHQSHSGDRNHYFHFQPDYRARTPLFPPHFSSLSDSAKEAFYAGRQGYMRDNSASFAQYLWREIVLGDTFNEGGAQLSRTEFGNYIYYIPDIVQTLGERGESSSMRKRHIEVKSVQARAKTLLSPEQTAAYLEILRHGKYEFQPVEDIQCVLLRYYPKVGGYTKRACNGSTGKYYRQNTVPFSYLTKTELTEHLAKNIADVLVVPLNLYLVLFRTGYECASRKERARLLRSPQFKHDMAVSMSLHTRLVKGMIGADELKSVDQKFYARNARRFGSNEALLDIGLDHLEVRRYRSPGLMAVNGDSQFVVKPFNITEYTQTCDGQSDWFDLLRDPQKFKLLCKQSGVRDLTEPPINAPDEDSVGF